MTQAQVKKMMDDPKVSKFRKMKALQDAIANLITTDEGNSEILNETLETLLKVLPQEHVFQAGNNWEVKNV
jgi:hypothetical protein